jgi:hypothetical protein
MDELVFASEDEALLYLAKLTGRAVAVGRGLTASERAKESLIEAAKTLVREDVLPRVKRQLLEYLGEGHAYERYVQPVEDAVTVRHTRGTVNDVLVGLRRSGLNPSAEEVAEFIAPYFKWLAFANGAYDADMRRNLEGAVLDTVARLKAKGYDVSPSHVEDQLVNWRSRRALDELPKWRKLDKPGSFDEMLNRVFREVDEHDLRHVMDEVLVKNVGYEDIKTTDKVRARPRLEQRQEVQRRLNLPEFREEFKSIAASLRHLHKLMDGRVLKDAEKKKIALWYKRAKLNKDKDLGGMFDSFAQQVEAAHPRIAKNYDVMLSGDLPTHAW